MEEYNNITKTDEYHKPTFGEVFDIEKEICRLALTNPFDISYLMDRYELYCTDENAEIETNIAPYFHEGGSVTVLHEMEQAYRYHKNGVIMAPFKTPDRVGIVVHTTNGTFKSAINGKIYSQPEYLERIRSYNRKKGFMAAYQDNDAHLSANEVETACDGLKTYLISDVFPEIHTTNLKDVK